MNEFLNTGALGPLRPGVSPMEVAELLGPPQAWMPSQEIGPEPVPRYWIYGKLELVVLFDEVPACAWFQIEHASQLRGKMDVLTDDFAINLDIRL